ncbi:MAG: TonB-dependent receptor [Bacteroidia bacterium]|nr:TonB-dependent receptor [Bacteroidia bacterium]
MGIFNFQKIIKSLLIVLCFSISGLLTAQNTGVVRGFVYLKETGEPVLFTNVVLKGTTLGIATDVNGFFTISKIPPGNYTIFISSMLGYDTLQEAVSVKAGEIVTRKLYLTKSAVQLKGVEVSAEQEAKETETQISVNKIDPLVIKKLPTVGGEPDLAQYLQVLPGVIFTGDQGGQLYIRGGSPVQNKVLLDGMIIYNPFHSIGLFSVFDADIIRNADVYSGGFGAEYGGRISSIMDITTRDGNKRRVAGKVAVSPFGAKVLVEGPLVKFKEDSKTTVSFILSSKTSYLPTTSKVLYSYVDPNGLPFSFSDYYGKISLNANNGSKLNLFGFNFNDKVSYQALQDMNWTSYGGGGNFLLVPQNSPILVNGNFAYSQYGIKLKPEGENEKSSKIKGFNMSIGFTYFMSKNELNYGIEVLGFRTDFDLFNSTNRHISQQESTTEIGGYFKYKWISKHKKLLIEPSFRLQYYASLGNTSPEPRLSLKWNIAKKFRFKFASGMYSQNLIAANSDRDVVNLFYGFLSGPDNLQETFTDEKGNVKEVTSKLQKANHYIAGFEFDLGRHFDLNIEGYRKDFKQLANLNRNKIFDDSPDNAARPDALKKDFIIETGKAQGIDVVLKYDYKRLYLWFVYSLGYVTRFDGALKDESGSLISYRPNFDRRHNANIVASYVFGENRNWEFDARWNIGSGFPFKPTGGFYEDLNFTNGISTDYTTTNGDLNYFFDEGKTKELPWYHRLDINIKRTFQFFDHTKLEVAAGATNVYSRKNVFYFDRVQYKRVDQLPILPTVSFVMTF